MANLKPFRFSLPVYDVVGKRGDDAGENNAGAMLPWLDRRR
jgi:hypothetical protein